MDNKNDAFDKIIDYERDLHKKNQIRIKKGIRVLLIIPIIFLVIMFMTESNKVVFLTLWIVSLFAIALYLISIEYMDYELSMKLREFGIRDEDDSEYEGLIEDRLDIEKIKRVANALSDSLALEDKGTSEVPQLEDKTVAEKQDEPKEKEKPRRPHPENYEKPRRPRPENNEKPRRPRPEEDRPKKAPSHTDSTKAMKDMVDAIGVEAAEEELMASIKRYVAEVNKSDQPIVVEPKKTAEDYAKMRRQRAKQKAQNEEE